MPQSSPPPDRTGMKHSKGCSSRIASSWKGGGSGFMFNVLYRTFWPSRLQQGSGVSKGRTRDEVCGWVPRQLVASTTAHLVFSFETDLGQSVGQLGGWTEKRASPPYNSTIWLAACRGQTKFEAQHPLHTHPLHVTALLCEAGLLEIRSVVAEASGNGALLLPKLAGEGLLQPAVNRHDFWRLLISWPRRGLSVALLLLPVSEGRMVT